MACSMPPMYWSTGMKWRAAAGSNGRSVLHGSQKRRKYHDESTNVSMVSVSRRPGRRRSGHVVWRNPWWRASGDWPVGRNSTSSGARTGSWSSGTGHDPVVGAVDDRDGATPEALARDQPVPQAVVDLALADALLLEPVDGAGLGRGDVEAVRKPLLIFTPSPVYAPPPFGVPVLGRLDGAHDRAGRAAVAKAQSRSSSAGTAMMAPVP